MKIGRQRNNRYLPSLSSVRKNTVYGDSLVCNLSNPSNPTGKGTLTLPCGGACL